MTAHYDQIGRTYTRTRAADPRISERLLELLQVPAGAAIVDIGAGTGNYSNALAEAGLRVWAVEPSPVMRAQARPHDRVSWAAGVGEALPFADGQFQGAIMTLCLHHLKDWRQAIREALRVSGGGPLVIFAFDITHKADFWLFDYFPELGEIDQDWKPTMAELTGFSAQELGIRCALFPFPLPPDLVDHFASADWANPRMYLRDDFRSGISSFAKLSPRSLEQGLNRLQADLENGNWNAQYGHLLELKEYDRGYLFIRIHRQP